MPVAERRDFDSTVPGFVYRFLRAFVRGICRSYFRVQVQGAPNVPERGPVIVAPVHRSFVDFLIASLVTRRKIFFMAKDSLWNSRLLGRFLESMGAFPVNRASADRLAIERSQSVLERGDVLILFPEGERRFGPAGVDLHEGAAFLAARTGAVVVPVGISGSAAAMPKGKKLPRPVKVSVVVGDPIDPPPRSERGRVARSQVHALTEQLTSALQESFDQAGVASARR